MSINDSELWVRRSDLSHFSVMCESWMWWLLSGSSFNTHRLVIMLLIYCYLWPLHMLPVTLSYIENPSFK